MGAAERTSAILDTAGIVLVVFTSTLSPWLSIALAAGFVAALTLRARRRRAADLSPPLRR